MKENYMSNEGTSRRSLLKAAAWAGPVIAVAIAAPAASASENDAAFIQFEGLTLGDGDRPYGTLYDSANNPLAGVPVTFDLVGPDPDVAVFDGGASIGIAYTDAFGIFVVPLQSTLESGTAQLTLHASVGSVESTVQISVVPD